jgi:CheY-like chemotaxis protein
VLVHVSNFLQNFLSQKNAQKISGKSSKNRNHSSLSILLAEDNEVNQMIIVGVMKKIGLQISVVSDGAEAVSQVCEAHKKFDLIFMDCEMPNIDGYEATKIIRQWESEQKANKTPIYALTAHALPEHIKLSQEVGMDGHLTKPVDMGMLCDAVDEVIKAKVQ